MDDSPSLPGAPAVIDVDRVGSPLGQPRTAGSGHHSVSGGDLGYLTDDVGSNPDESPGRTVESGRLGSSTASTASAATRTFLKTVDKDLARAKLYQVCTRVYIGFGITYWIDDDDTG